MKLFRIILMAPSIILTPIIILKYFLILKCFEDISTVALCIGFTTHPNIDCLPTQKVVK